MNIEQVAEALGKPVSHIEAIARGYTKKGAEPRPIPTTFEMDEAHHATTLGGKHFVIRQRTVRAEGRAIYIVAGTVEQCPDAAAAERAACRLDGKA